MNYKRFSLALLVFLAIAVFISDLVGTEKICGGSEFYGCMSRLHSFIVALYILVPAAVLGTVGFFLAERAYSAWSRFARWAVPLSILLVALAPAYGSDWYLPIEKGTVALATMLVFSIVSIVIILRNRNR
jgi:hypothetical protein